MTQPAPSTSGERAPRVFHLIPSDGFGGVETAARSAAEKSASDCDLTVYFMAGATVASDRRRIADHPKRALNHPLTTYRTIRDVLDARPDILVCSLWRTMLAGTIVKLLRPDTRLICFLHLDRVAWYDRAIHRLALWLADEIWADSQATLDARVGPTPKPRRIVSFVIEANRAERPVIAAPTFVNWSRLHRQKGHDRAIELIRLLRAAEIDATLDIWGADNGELPALERLASGRGLAGLVRFCGPIDRDRLDQAADGATFFLQLSRNEGMAMSVIEGMQRGLVPVVTAVGEIGRYVDDGANGMIVDPDDLAAAAKRIAAILQSPPAVARLSAQARRTWAGHPFYAEDFCAAAKECWARRRGAA